MEIVRFAFGAPRASTGNGTAAIQGPAAIPGTGSGATSAAASPVAARDAGQAAAMPVTEGTQQSREDFQAVLDKVSRYINPERRSLSFRLSEELGRTIVSVYDAETDELIRQIPGETVVRIASTMQELARQGHGGIPASGLLLSEQA